MSEFKDLLKAYLSAHESNQAAAGIGPVLAVTNCFQSEDSWRVVCHYADDIRQEHSVNNGELLGWMWALVKGTMLKPAAGVE